MNYDKYTRKNDNQEHNQGDKDRKNYVSFCHVNMIGVVESIKPYMMKDNESYLVKLNIKVPADFDNPTEGPFNGYYVSCFGYKKDIVLGQWVYIQNGRLGKYKSIRNGVTNYYYQITCSNHSLLNLNELVDKVVSVERAHDMHEFIDGLKTKISLEEEKK